ncbi:MAG: C-terminal glycine zipper region [Pseudomonadota bacterium]|jgi:ElaB/YqjD/DUF883 family membrane-anchored ribosome-binding protein|nr:C-terminal glycine zipper region [Pseudomonadota bacterium]
MNANTELMDKLSDAIQPAQQVARKATRVKKTALDAADRTDKFVHSNPWSVIGGAVAAGAAIAMLLGMRKRR